MAAAETGTASEVARALRIPIGTVWRYKSQGAIRPAGRDARGRPLYRLVDVAAERHRRRVATGAVTL